jgi:hypothetical protein
MIFSTKPEDFSARDQSIRINSYTTVRRRTALSHESFAAYWRDVHGLLCARLPGLGWYVQHHFSREHDGHLWPLAEGVKPMEHYVLDGAVEIGFASSSDQAKFKKASPILFSDEQNIFDESVAYDLPNGSRTYVDRLRDPIPNGAESNDHLHVHFHSAHDDHALFAKYMQDSFAKILAEDETVLKLRLHIPEPHDNSQPNPPAPDVDHAVRPARTSLAIMEIAFANPLSRRRFLASDTYQATLAGQKQHISHLSAFRVSGVFTYIRDGALTTAGLRGSRAAELIRDLGAINQVESAVERLVFTGSL